MSIANGSGYVSSAVVRARHRAAGLLAAVPDPSPTPGGVTLWHADGTPVSNADQYQAEQDARALSRKRADRRALRTLLAEEDADRAPDLSRFSATLADELERPRPDLPMAIEKLAGDRHITSASGSRKNGKTTLVANVGHCGITGEKFLGSFATFLDPGSGFAAVNAEMTTDDYLDCWRPLRASAQSYRGRDPYRRVRFLHCRDEGIRLNLLNDVTAERFVAWLRDSRAAWLALDPTPET